MTDLRERLREIRTFPSLVKFLRDELDWPIDSTDDFEDLTFEYTPEELGIDPGAAAKIDSIQRLRPLSTKQPWGIFFVKFEPKKLPVVALRRLLSQVAVKKRASANSEERAAWAADDLLFISNYGEGDERQITFAHFSQDRTKHDLPTLKVLGWDNLDTALHLDDAADTLRERLAWPDDEDDVEGWREAWRSAFTVRHHEVISTSRDLSIRLAELARAIRDRIGTVLAIETETGPLTELMTAFQEALIHDLDAEGFADMYAQTIAYGLLSARIANPKSTSADNLAEQMPVTNPFLKELMETFLHIGGRRGKRGGPGIDFDELGVSEVVALLDCTNMEAVIRDFGDRNPQEDPVIHFYEHFLEAYDKKQKVSRGVFYTPRPVVSYIVRSVDEALRTEFGLEDGLADTATWRTMAARRKDLAIPAGMDADEPFVRILDPATGTGTFLVEVIEIIYTRLAANWRAHGHSDDEVQELWNEYVPQHLLPRVYGYELQMAPYAIAHLKLGLKLLETGYRFKSHERARIYLTNSLEPAQDFTGQLEFAIPALAHEAQAVNDVKREQRFTVVIGNPPYSGISSNMTPEAQGLVDAYKMVDGQPLNERKLWLQDDYVKFIRLGEITIHRAGTGLLGFITNHGYLDNPTFRGMRRSLMTTFQSIRVLDLHGNAHQSDQSPDGSKDDNVFAIRQGVAVCIAARVSETPLVWHADLWGARTAKYSWLTLHSVGDTPFTGISPDSPYYFFAPQDTAARAEYDRCWAINEVMPINSAGFLTARDHFAIDFDAETLLARILAFADPQFSDTDIRERYFAGRGSSKYAAGDTRGWKVPAAREKVRRDQDWRTRARICLYRPFDWRTVYWTDGMVDWPRPALDTLMEVPGQVAFCITRINRQRSLGYFFVSRLIADFHCLDTVADSTSLFPWRLDASTTLQLGRHLAGINLAPKFVSELATAISVSLDKRGLPVGCETDDLFYYIYAVFHSDSYRTRYAEFLKIDFPRLPLPGSLSLFRALAHAGGELVASHLLEMTKLNPPITTYTGPTSPEVASVGWSDDTVWLDALKTKNGHAVMPGTIGFRGVPEVVWNFHIGGYQVCHKWLKDRKGRKLTPDDLSHYQMIVGALADTLRVMAEIDTSIEQHGGWPDAFSTAGLTEGGAN